MAPGLREGLSRCDRSMRLMVSATALPATSAPPASRDQSGALDRSDTGRRLVLRPLRCGRLVRREAAPHVATGIVAIEQAVAVVVQAVVADHRVLGIPSRRVAIRVGGIVAMPIEVVVPSIGTVRTEAGTEMTIVGLVVSPGPPQPGSRG
jgi:hypothetical protein